MRGLIISIILSLATAGITACGNERSPSAPDTSSNAPLYDPTEHYAGHSFWSYNLIEIDPVSLESSLIPARQITEHWNALKWLEQSPCTNCLHIISIVPAGNDTIMVTVRITHPFTTANLTGFDVRGIAIFGASHHFLSCGLFSSDRTKGDSELVNADGYTSLYSGLTAGKGPGGLQGYIKGKLAASQPPNGTLNGYKRLTSSGSGNTRNAFFAGALVDAQYEIAKTAGPIVMGYAVDVNWAPPTTIPVTDPMTQFPPEANCPEPWLVLANDATITGNSSATITMDVYDWQGKGSHDIPIVECPELFDGTLPSSWVADGAGYSRWEVSVPNSKGASPGTYKCLIEVEDNDNDPVNKPWLDLSSYKIINIAVKSENQGWALTWGGTDESEANEIALDPDGFLYATGRFYGECDVDPGSAVDNRLSKGENDIYLSKFDSSGTWLWALTWGGSGDDRPYGVAVDSEGSLYVAGMFKDSVDFDPSEAGTEQITSKGGSDVFLSKFDSDGTFLWVRSWGYKPNDSARGIAVDSSGNCVLMGYMKLVTNERYRVFIYRLDSDGNDIWNVDWIDCATSPAWDDEFGMAVDLSDNIFLTGTFDGIVDFDPGGGTDEHTSVGTKDVFLSKFDSSGSHQWVATWGGAGPGLYDAGTGVDCDSSGNAYVIGYYEGTVDFDPGNGSDTHSADGWDTFVSKFSPSGIFQWVKLIGGEDVVDGIFLYGQNGTGIAVDNSDNVLATGNFAGSVDFDPGSGSDMHTTTGVENVFLLKLSSSGSFIWCRTWGGVDACCAKDGERMFDTGMVVTIDENDSIYHAGGFSSENGDPVDLAPSGSPCNDAPDNHSSTGSWTSFLQKYLSDGCW